MIQGYNAFVSMRHSDKLAILDDSASTKFRWQGDKGHGEDCQSNHESLVRLSIYKRIF